MGRASGGSAPSSRSATRRRDRRNQRAQTSPRSKAQVPSSAQLSGSGEENLQAVRVAAQRLRITGATAAMAAPARQADLAAAERRAAWQMAGQVSGAVMPILNRAEVVKVPSLRASRTPQLFADNREAIAFANSVDLSDPVFFDFRHPAGGTWMLTQPEPIRFDGALAWSDDEVLNIVPIWVPLTADGAVKRDADDALAGGPVMQVIFGPEAAVMNRLGPGIMAGASEDGSLYSWPEMPDGKEHSRAAERALRCSLRCLDLFAARAAERGHQPMAVSTLR